MCSLYKKNEKQFTFSKLYRSNLRLADCKCADALLIFFSEVEFIDRKCIGIINDVRGIQDPFAGIHIYMGFHNINRKIF